MDASCLANTGVNWGLLLIIACSAIAVSVFLWLTFGRRHNITSFLGVLVLMVLGSFWIISSQPANASTTCPDRQQKVATPSQSAPSSAVPTPNAPIIDTPNAQTIADNTPTITGKGENGDVVIVSEGGTIICTAIVSDGAWSCTPTIPLSDGEHSFKAIQKNRDGKTSGSSNTIVLKIDTTAPSLPIILTPTNGTVTNTAPQVNGTGETGASITLILDDTQTFTIPVVSVPATADTGTWSRFLPEGLSDGPHTLQATQTDEAGNTSSSTPTITFTIDSVHPTVTVNQKVGQPDPTSSNSIFFTVTFSEPINPATFTVSDIILATSPSSPTATISTFANINSTTWEFEVKNMANNTTVSATISAGVVADLAGNTSLASTSIDNSVTYSVSQPTVQSRTTNDNTPTVNGECTPGHSIQLAITGPASHTYTAVCSQDGTQTYNILDTLPDGTYTMIATDTTGNITGTSSTLVIDTVNPTVTINQKAGQADPTNQDAASFTIVFSEPIDINSFTASDLTVTNGTATIIQINSTTWEATVTGMTSGATTTVSLGAQKITDAAGNGNSASTSTDNSVTFDATQPSVTVNQKTGQADPTTTDSASFTVTFSKPITGLSAQKFTISGTTGTITGFTQINSTTWELIVTGMTNGDTVTVSLAANQVSDAVGNSNTASTSTDNSVTYSVDQPTIQSRTTNDNTPTVSGQCTPGHSMQLVLSGPENHTYTTTCDQNGVHTYDIPDTLPDGLYTMVATDTTSNLVSTSSTLIIDTVAPTVTINQKAGQADPTNIDSAQFTIVFNEPIDPATFTASDLSVTNGSAMLTQINSTTWEATTTDMTNGSATTVNLATQKVNDAAGNGNIASTSTDNSVTYDTTGPSVTVNQKTGQADPTSNNSIFFTVTFSEPINPTSFSASDIILATSPSSPTTSVIALTNINATTWEFEVGNMSTATTVTANISSDVVTDLAGNSNTASTSSDNSVVYQPGQPLTFCEQQTTWTCVPTTGNTYGTHTFQLPARQMYANTGLYLNAGETAQITETGTWTVNERDGQVGGLCKYADVVVRINFTYHDTNVTCVNGTATFTAPSSGVVYISAFTGDDMNDFRGGRYLASGAKTITITSNGKTVPTIPASEAATYDFGAVASGMVEIWGEHTSLVVPATIAQMDAATIKRAMDRLDEMYTYHAEIQPILPYFGQRIRFAEDNSIQSTLNAYMLASNPIRVQTEAISSTDPIHRLTRIGEPLTDNYYAAHELGHVFTIPERQWFYMVSNTLEVWPNIFTCHALERLGLTTPELSQDQYHYCTDVIAGNDQFHNGDWANHDIALGFFMQFQHQYGWDFYEKTFATILAVKSNADVNDSWKLVYDAMTAAAGTDISPAFQAWGVPMTDSAP